MPKSLDKEDNKEDMKIANKERSLNTMDRSQGFYPCDNPLL
jgi:hypothetical protein